MGTVLFGTLAFFRWRKRGAFLFLFSGNGFSLLKTTITPHASKRSSQCKSLQNTQLKHPKGIAQLTSDDYYQVAKLPHGTHERPHPPQ
jgi:hypothetical protein